MINADDMRKRVKQIRYCELKEKKFNRIIDELEIKKLMLYIGRDVGVDCPDKIATDLIRLIKMG